MKAQYASLQKLTYYLSQRVQFALIDHNQFHAKPMMDINDFNTVNKP